MLFVLFFFFFSSFKLVGIESFVGGSLPTHPPPGELVPGENENHALRSSCPVWWQVSPVQEKGRKSLRMPVLVSTRSFRHVRSVSTKTPSSGSVQFLQENSSPCPVPAPCQAGSGTPSSRNPSPYPSCPKPVECWEVFLSEVSRRSLVSLSHPNGKQNKPKSLNRNHAVLL